ncbi:hypothetical protein [Kribbella qitaiheensis]|uniref:hypothetical protein n=1 Tax=Kribbella qitaiheensis TaxID=1544730 RepID=UPI0036D39ADE
MLTIRCCKASKSSRSPVHTTNSPFISSLQMECAVLLGHERRGHVHDGVASLVAAAAFCADPLGDRQVWIASAIAAPSVLRWLESQRIRYASISWGWLASCV